jgi:hypothetical protein
MPAGGLTASPDEFLLRARSLCARGEALGARLVAWTGAGLSLAWESDAIEEAILCAVSVREEVLASDRAWSCGIAEGELEPLAPDGQRMHLACGPALTAAASLARIARPGAVLVDGDLRALRAGQLALLVARTATDAGRRVRGWRLDLERPWKRGVLDESLAPADSTDRYIFPPEESDVLIGREGTHILDAGATQPMPAVTFATTEGSPTDVRELVDATSDPSAPPPSPLADKVRRLALGQSGAGDPADALVELRRVRAAAEGGPPAGRCQAALALAVALSVAQRPEEALLEALDALARAREAEDAKAVAACRALLAKLYAAAGRSEEASALLKT